MRVLILLFVALMTLSNVTSSISNEITSVSRIQGDSPEDLINQLERIDVELSNADYIKQDIYTGISSESRNILKSLFDSSQINFVNDFDPLKKILDLDADYGKLLIIDSPIEPNYLNKDLNNIQDIFQTATPLVIYNVKPKENKPTSQFTNSLSRYTNIIGSTFSYSNYFTNSLLCNLGNHKTIGQSFRNARNKYYEVISPESDLTSLSLLSFHLYGNALTKYSTPKFDLPDFCNDFFSNNNEGYSFASYILESEYDLIEESSFTYKIENLSDSQILILNNKTFQTYGSEFILPYETQEVIIPEENIISNITYTLSNPINLTLNLSESSNQRIVKNSCNFNNQSESVNSYLKHENSKKRILFKINPVRVINCSSNQIELFQNFKYFIDLEGEIPFYFDISVDDFFKPNEIKNITIDIVNIKPKNSFGIFRMYDSSNTTLFEKDISDEYLENIIIPLQAPDVSGKYQYYVEYIDENNNSIKDSFEIQVKEVLLKPTISTFDNDLKIDLETTSFSNSQLQVEIKTFVENSLSSIKNFTLDANSEKNISSIIYLNQSNNTISKDIKLEVSYGNAVDIYNQLAIFNHEPKVKTEFDSYTIQAGNTLQVYFDAYDIENKYDLDVTINNSNFTQVNDDLFEWEINDGIEGNFTFEITSSDGELSSSDFFKVEVLKKEVNEEISLNIEKNYIIQTAGENVIINLDAENFQGEYSSLVFTINSKKFKQIDNNSFKWDIPEDRKSDLQITAKVKDELNNTDEKSIFIKVLEIQNIQNETSSGALGFIPNQVKNLGDKLLFKIESNYTGDGNVFYKTNIDEVKIYPQGLFSWIFTEKDIGVNTVTLEMYDDSKLLDSISFDVEVVEVQGVDLEISSAILLDKDTNEIIRGFSLTDQWKLEGKITNGSLSVGSNYSLIGAFKNIGTELARNTKYKINVGNQLMLDRDMVNLGNGESMGFVEDFTLNSTGTDSLQIFVDSEEKYHEEIEENNMILWEVTIN